MRYIFFIILLYILFRLVKALFSSSTKRDIDIMSSDEKLNEDEMVKDPCCEVYIPLRNAYSVRIKGEFLHFCSKECLERYKKERV